MTVQHDHSHLGAVHAKAVQDAFSYTDTKIKELDEAIKTAGDYEVHVSNYLRTINKSASEQEELVGVKTHIVRGVKMVVGRFVEQLSEDTPNTERINKRIAEVYQKASAPNSTIEKISAQLVVGALEQIAPYLAQQPNIIFPPNDKSAVVFRS